MDAPNDLTPLFAYAPPGAEFMNDVRAHYAEELSTAVGPDVSYVGTTIEPTSQPATTRQQFKADWFGKFRPSTGAIYASKDTIGRIGTDDLGGNF